jgi:hypothetical protein
MTKTTQSQVRRRDYLLSRLDGYSDKAAKKKLGIKDKKYEERVRAGLERDLSLTDAPRSGRKPLYTEDTLEDALDYFDQNDWLLITKKELVAGLQQVEILQPNATVDGFYTAFKKHLLKHDLHLKWGQRPLTFALSHQHEVWRHKWCIKQQAVLTSALMKDYWFCDEILIEEGGHPKGK